MRGEASEKDSGETVSRSGIFRLGAVREINPGKGGKGVGDGGQEAKVPFEFSSGESRWDGSSNRGRGEDSRMAKRGSGDKVLISERI
jgi:hypothetical protein